MSDRPSDDTNDVPRGLGCNAVVSQIVAPDTTIRPATLDDLKFILSLMDKESRAIGFVPKQRYESAITGERQDGPWTCRDKIWIAEVNDDLVGFVYATYGRSAKVTQVCIQEDARKIERGKLLIEAVQNHAVRSGLISASCGCANDLESNAFWNAIGWEQVGIRKGQYIDGRKTDRVVNVYHKQFGGLFTG